MADSAKLDDAQVGTPRRRWRWAVFTAILLVLLSLLYLERAALWQWSWEKLLPRSTVSFPTFNGVGLSWRQAQIGDLQFELQTQVGPLSVQLQNLQADYDLSAARLDHLQAGKLRLRFDYQPSADTSNSESASASIPVLSFRQLTIETLDADIDTPAGRIVYVGSAEVVGSANGGLNGILRREAESIKFELSSDLRSADILVESSAASRIAGITYRRATNDHYQAGLEGNALDLLSWLNTTPLLPSKLHDDLNSANESALLTSLAGIVLNLQADADEGLRLAKGRLLLTRADNYLASCDLSWNGAKARFGVDGHFDMAFSDALAQAQNWLPEQAVGWQITAGRLMGTFRYKWRRQANSSAEMFIRGYQLSGHKGPIGFGDGFVNLELTKLQPLSAALQLELAKLKLGQETELQDMHINARLNDKALTVEQASLPAFGGILRIMPATLDITQRPLQLSLAAEGLDLSQLLEALNYPQLSGSGTLNAKLPLSLAEQSIEVRDGSLNGTRPGILRYQGPIADGGNIAFKALRNLRYHSLQGKLNYQPNGDYLLGLRLEGKNPELLSGHPLAFNLNLSGKLPELLQKGLLAGDFEQPILEQVKTQPRH